jgi:lipopolysaccharide export LptBFGC system permease protein LptF
MVVSDVEPLRFFIACGSLLWAVLLMLPGDSFSRPTYAYMKALAPEHMWALAHLVHAVVSVTSLLTGIKSRLVWVLDPILGCLLWTTSGIAMLFSVYPVPAAIAPHLIGAIAAWWLLVRYKGAPSAS